MLADERNVPAYVIFSDVALREMARVYPTTPAEFRRIPGVGEQKLKDFAEPFLAAIADYLQANPRQSFDVPTDPSRRKPNAAKVTGSEAETLLGLVVTWRTRLPNRSAEPRLDRSLPQLRWHSWLARNIFGIHPQASKEGWDS